MAILPDRPATRLHAVARRADAAQLTPPAQSAVDLARHATPVPAWARAAYVTERTIDGRPVVIYVERDRGRWLRALLMGTAITTPIAGVLLLVIWSVAWVLSHLALIAGTLALALVVIAIVSGLRRAGVCCPGLHCEGCGHR